MKDPVILRWNIKKLLHLFDEYVCFHGLVEKVIHGQPLFMWSETIGTCFFV